MIVGGESGPDARPFDLAWARHVLAQGRDGDVPVFVKQMGSRARVGGLPFRTVHKAGADPAEWPADLRVQEFPRC